VSRISRMVGRAVRLRCWHITVNVVARSHALSRRPRAVLYTVYAGVPAKGLRPANQPGGGG